MGGAFSVPSLPLSLLLSLRHSLTFSMSALPDHALLKLVERIVTPARANLLPSPYNCAHCGKEGSASEETLKECGRCNMLRYCDKTCQTAAWPSHRYGIVAVMFVFVDSDLLAVD